MVTVTDFDERREVPADRVLELARRGAAAGFHERCLADTIGVGAPSHSKRLLARPTYSTTPRPPPDLRRRQ
jgi:hypothetical protein